MSSCEQPCDVVQSLVPEWGKLYYRQLPSDNACVTHWEEEYLLCEVCSQYITLHSITRSTSLPLRATELIQPLNPF